MKCHGCEQTFTPTYSLSDLLSFYPLYLDHFCPQCYAQLQHIQNACPYCAGVLPCDECKEWQAQYHLHHHALYHYNDFAKRWLNRYKIMGDYQLKDSFERSLYRALHSYVMKGWILVPIPLDEMKLKHRGFNQVSSLLKASHLYYRDDLLIKTPLEKAQGLKTREERLQTPQPFHLIKTSDLPSKVLLVDDIYTTGRTITHAYDCFLSHGCHVQSFSLFR